MNTTKPFDDAPIIHRDNRAQAIEDGILIDLTEWAKVMPSSRLCAPGCRVAGRTSMRPTDAAGSRYPFLCGHTATPERRAGLAWCTEAD